MTHPTIITPYYGDPSRSPGGLSLINDSETLMGAFVAAVTAMLTDLLADGLIHVDAITQSPVNQIAGTAVAVNDGIITFEDGQTVEIQGLLALHV